MLLWTLHSYDWSKFDRAWFHDPNRGAPVLGRCMLVLLCCCSDCDTHTHVYIYIYSDNIEFIGLPP